MPVPSLCALKGKNKCIKICDYHRNSAIHQCSAVGAALAAKRAGKEMELLACQPGKFADKSAPTLILRQLFTQEAEN